MGLADFIADVGRNTAVGQIAQAAGGRNIDQRAHDMFVNQELPKFAEAISQAQTRADIEKVGAALIGTAMKRGVPPKGVENLMQMLVGPALQNLQRGDVDSIIRDYGPTAAQPRPEGVEGPLTQSGNFIDPTAGKPIDEAGAIRLNQAFGGNAATMDNLLRAPWQNAAARANTGKTDAETAALIAKQSRLASIPNEPRESGISLQQLAEYPSLAQVEPLRPKEEDPLLDVRRRDYESRITRNEREGQAALTRAGAARDRENRAANAETQTATESAMQPGDQSIIEAEIASIASKRKKTDPASIKKIASDMGYELEGSPILEQASSFNPFGAKSPALTGEFTLRRKPRVVTKSKPGGATSGGLPEGVTVRRIR